jgi:hypothetical protein
MTLRALRGLRGEKALLVAANSRAVHAVTKSFTFSQFRVSRRVLKDCGEHGPALSQFCHNKRGEPMEKWAWRLGMLVLSGVPAIVGGGIVWQIFEKWTPVIVWEAVLLFLLSIVLAKGGRRRNAHGV